MATPETQQLSDALLDFSTAGRFPEDIASLPPVSGADLQPAIDVLERAKKELGDNIHNINQDTKDDVSSWVRNAKQLQEDIIRSKTIANDIVRQSEAPDVSGEAIQDAQEKTEFLGREVQYTKQLRGAVSGIREAKQLLGRVEQASSERRVIDALRLLEEYWTALDNVGVSKSCRVMKLLDARAFELKAHIHETFNQIWKKLIHVDVDSGKLSIHDTVADETMKMSEAVIGLKSFKEVDERMEQLWRNLDAAIVSPRMNAKGGTEPTVIINDDALETNGAADGSVNGVLSDLEKALAFLAEKLPPDLRHSLSGFMMNDVIPNLIQNWLNPAVPSSLKDMTKFQQMIQRCREFCDRLEEVGYDGIEDLQDWVNKAHMVWLGKCRENALNTVRTRLAGGIGQPKEVEKIEKHMVSLSEGKELATTGAGAAADTNDWGDDWGDAWGAEENVQPAAPSSPDQLVANEAADDGTDAWGWDGDDGAEAPETPADADEKMGDEDDGADAWGWGDEDTTETPATEPSPKKPGRERKAPSNEEGTRELILRETYNISSMPEPVLELIFAVLEDGALLTKEVDEYGWVKATAPGLFSLPTFALALFRAISPHYYSLDDGGNMFLYNDAMYLGEKLSDFSKAWKEREDLTDRARSMLRLDNDIKTLQSFANRSYANEMNVQRTILHDLLGGSQSLMQQDDTEGSVEAGTARIRTMADKWERILARSVWSQAIGSLAEALATRLLTDVLEMSSIGQDEAYSVAKLIASATALDDLFLPSKLSGAERAGDDEVPATAQYAPSWLRLQFLSEVLQSNLNEVRYLWVESELSLHFSADEVVDLINASFEDNPRTRDTIREIRDKPAPMTDV